MSLVAVVVLPQQPTVSCWHLVPFPLSAPGSFRKKKARKLVLALTRSQFQAVWRSLVKVIMEMKLGSTSFRYIEQHKKAPHRKMASYKMAKLG